MSVKQDVKTIASHTFTIPLSAGATIITLVADTMGVANAAIGATPKVAKSLVKSPFDAGVGFIMENEGVAEDVAKKRAYKYVDQDVTITIEETGKAAGKAIALLWKDDPVKDDKANS